MANTVPILNFTNTFGDLLSQQNRAAVELNTLGANNYTKDSGTLILNGAGTGLSVTGAAILGSTIVANTSSLIGDVSALANVFINGAGFALDVANNANIRRNTITDTLLANTIIRTTTVNASGNVFANDITSNNSIRAVSVVSSGNTIVNALRSNTSILGASLNITGQAITNALQANTAVESSTLIVSNLGTVNALQSNTSVNTAIVTATNTIIGNNIQANTGLSSSTLSVSGGTFANTIAANTSISVPTIIVTSKLDANSTPISFFDSLQTTGQLSVGGNFIINGTTVYSTNTFTLNANSAVGQISSFNVNRGSSGANASIRWNETQDYWDIVDVNNPSSYSKILTANLISDSITSTSSDTFASSLAANTLNNALQANVVSLQSQITSNVNSINSTIAIIQGVDLGQNTTITAVNNYAATGFARANTSTNTFIGTTGTANATSGVTTLTSTNGMTIAGSANTLTINTPQDVRTSSSPTFNGLTLTNALTITQGGTSATSAAAALTNLLPTGTVAGYVLTTSGPGTYFWAPIGAQQTIPGTTISSTRLSYTANGSGVSYTTPTYIPGASQLRVYFDGVRQFASGYTETSNTVVTFGTAVPSGVNILVEVDGYINNPYYANNITFTAPQGSIPGSANTIQLAIQDLETRKAALSAATFTGPIQAPTASSGTSNTQVATTAFVNNLANSGTTFAHSITGNAGTVTNGVYTSGDQTISGTKTFNSTITGSVSGSAATVTSSSQSSITTLSNLTTVGTITSGTWSGSFGAVSGANLTSLNASNLGSGTVPSARLTGIYAINISGSAATANNGGVTSVTVNGSARTGAVTIRGLGLGGEVWNDVTSSRDQGVNYTNSRGYPIQVQGNYGCNSGGQGFIYINDVLISRWAAQFNGCGGFSVNMPCIVPPGATYRLDSMAGGKISWYELY
jgi:hypothetical protein